MSYIGNTPEAAELKRLADALESAAKDSAAASKTASESAASAKRAACWTMIAALVSLLGIVISSAITLGWVDGFKSDAKECKKIAASPTTDLGASTVQPAQQLN